MFRTPKTRNAFAKSSRDGARRCSSRFFCLQLIFFFVHEMHVQTFSRAASSLERPGVRCRHLPAKAYNHKYQALLTREHNSGSSPLRCRALKGVNIYSSSHQCAIILLSALREHFRIFYVSCLAGSSD